MKSVSDLLNEIKYNLESAPTHVKLDQSFERFSVGKKTNKNGWLVGKSWSYNGKEYFAATYAAWNRGNDRFKFLSWTKEEELQNPGLKKELQLLNEKADAELEKIAKENREKILKKFETFAPLEACENRYLKKKQVKTYQGLYQDSVKNLVVPVYEDFDKSIAGYQTILLTHKSFPTGQKVQGNFFFFGDVHSAEYVYLCEGIATAATIFETTKVPTVSCFQANNLPAVIKRIKTELKGKNVVIACDNDPVSRTGIEYAQRAKAKFGNAAIVMPNFGSEPTAFTDFNDLYVTHGYDETKRQLQFDSSEFVTVDFLGRSRQGTFFFYSNREKTLREYSFEKIRAANLCELARDAWWAQRFVPNYDKEGNPRNTTNWKATAELIAEKQQMIGFYNPSNLRGLGSWVDNGHHVLNLGDKILIDFEEAQFGRNKQLKKFYTPSSNTLTYIEKPKSDFSAIKRAIDLVDFKSDRDRILCIGYLAFAQLYTTQHWRPHLWIRADRGSGKSSLLSLFDKLIQNSIIIQDSTAAGVRQSLQSDAFICLVDEAEGESLKTKQLLELARQSSSGSNSSVLRGTVSGESISYKPELSFVFASIRAPELTLADESRIIDIFLSKPYHTDHERNKKRVSAFYEAEKLGHDLFSYMNQNLESFNMAREQVHSELMALGFDARFADQYAPILSGYLCLYPGADLSEIANVALIQEATEIQNEETDSQEFYDTLMQTMVRVDKEEKSLGRVLKEYAADPESQFYKNVLSDYGIHYLPRNRSYCFSKNNHLKNLIARQSKYKNYWSAMKNNPNFEYKNNKIDGKTGKTFEVTF